MAPPIPPDEAERLEALRCYDILDTEPEAGYDDLTELAAEICGCPIAFVGFIDETRQWMKSTCGLPPEVTEVPREITVCSTTVCMGSMLIVPDMSKDPRFAELPYVAGDPHLRFYCGMPLINPDGHAVGSLCVLDFEPKEIEFSRQEALRRLSHQVVTQLELRRSLASQREAMQELEAARQAVEEERAKSDRLLLNILPAKIAEELKEQHRVAPHFYESVTVLFTDFQDFTLLTERMEPKGLVDLLDQYFTEFDEIIARHDLEKLKTIGDAYMCAGGLPEERRGHAVDACLAALEMLSYARQAKAQRDRLRLPSCDIRIGIHTGPVMAGVVGAQKFTYDIWGDAVNIAARMEAASEGGRINISESTLHHIAERFETEPRGPIEVKNKGELQMHFLNRIRPEFSRDAEGYQPNDQFVSQGEPAARDFGGFLQR
jgi:class 3 adenylate cyclase